MPRDEFSTAIKETLAKRVALRCSNLSCQGRTSGPHSDPLRSVNLGVASHITAAAPGGPRYDTSLTAKERVSIENGIWLCEKCAKLIDTDVQRFTVPILRSWKMSAEAAALRSLNGELDPEFFPQPISAMHTPIPKIAGLPYDDARIKLISAGWQPISNNWSYAHKQYPITVWQWAAFLGEGILGDYTRRRSWPRPLHVWIQRCLWKQNDRCNSR